MRYTTWFTSALIVCIFIIASTLSSVAATVGDQLEVSAHVPEYVTVTANPLIFGDVALTTNSNATTIITVTAPTSIGPIVALDAGLHLGGERKVSDGADPEHTIPYVLYKDSQHSLEWGDAGYGDTYTAGTPWFTSVGGGQYDLTVYGRIGASQPYNATEGDYFDTVQVTVYY